VLPFKYFKEVRNAPEKKLSLPYHSEQVSLRQFIWNRISARRWLMVLNASYSRSRTQEASRTPMKLHGWCV
jgi:hypothetical protein